MQFPKTQLKHDYFQASKPWWFNSPDMMYFAYILLGAVIAILLFFSMIGLSFRYSNPEVVTPSSTPEIAQENKTPVEQTLISKTPVESASVDANDFQSALESAQTQNTYDLRVQAFERLLQQDQFSPTEKKQIESARDKNLAKIARAKKQLALIDGFLEKEYFSDAILRSQNLLKEGDLLGTYRDEAQKQLEKAHLKKIDYFLIQKANITKAAEALKSAEADQVSPEKLAHYHEQIKSLRAAGN